ncbi:MAG: hypothetical protein LBU65_10720 [Planctomycetaceae bacterium]|jgi:hypothetical protein|nr:hypothetical protein [Planctomycetaceae bacterium]
MKFIKTIMLLFVSLSIAAGCGTKKPDGIPELVSTKITVTNGSSPITQAKITLTPAAGGAVGGWSMYADTDESGVAEIKTVQGSWSAKGVPAGDYIVYVTKMSKIESEPMPEGIDDDAVAKAKYMAEQEKKLAARTSEIPKTLTQAATTPLKLTVTSGSPTELSVDVSQHK